MAMLFAPMKHFHAGVRKARRTKATSIDLFYITTRCPDEGRVWSLSTGHNGLEDMDETGVLCALDVAQDIESI